MRMIDVLLPAALFAAEYGARIVLAAVILVRSPGTPAVRLSWLVIVFALPIVGVIAYLLVITAGSSLTSTMTCSDTSTVRITLNGRSEPGANR